MFAAVGGMFPGAALGGAAEPAGPAADGGGLVFTGGDFGITIDIGTMWLSAAAAVLDALAPAPAALDALPCMSDADVEHAAQNAANILIRRDNLLMTHRLWMVFR